MGDELAEIREACEALKGVQDAAVVVDADPRYLKFIHAVTPHSVLLLLKLIEEKDAGEKWIAEQLLQMLVAIVPALADAAVVTYRPIYADYVLSWVRQLANTHIQLRTEFDQLRSECDTGRKLKQNYYDEAVKGWQKFRVAETEIQRLTERCGELSNELARQVYHADDCPSCLTDAADTCNCGPAQQMKAALIAKVWEMGDKWNKQTSGQWYGNAAWEIAAALEKVEIQQ